jgi:uncharacterized RDD family membrane protein YckC
MTIYKYAGFWRRFIAYMIDGCIISVILIVLAFIAGVAFFAGTISGGGGMLMSDFENPEKMASFAMWFWVVSSLINIAYFTYFYGTTGRTPGKMLLGLQVVSTEGKPISFGIAFLRSVGYMISSLVFCLGFIWIGLDRKKQGWHDKIAGTVVIIRNPEIQSEGLSIPDTPSPCAQPSGKQETLDN